MRLRPISAWMRRTRARTSGVTFGLFVFILDVSQAHLHVLQVFPPLIGEVGDSNNRHHAGHRECGEKQNVRHQKHQFFEGTKTRDGNLFESRPCHEKNDRQ